MICRRLLPPHSLIVTRHAEPASESPRNIYRYRRFLIVGGKRQKNGKDEYVSIPSDMLAQASPISTGIWEAGRAETGIAGMEQWTIVEPSEGLFRVHINFGGEFRFWCQFDYSISPSPKHKEVEIEFATDADADTIKWFAPLRWGMIREIERQREDGREYVGIRIVICKIYAHEIDTTEYGCEYYGGSFVSSVLKSRAMLVSDLLPEQLVRASIGPEYIP